jgi:2-hydroxy-3-oxopropionate reductase
MANLGFIGLGLMGRPMAGRLIDGGHTLFLHSRSGVPQELVEKGGTACPDGRAVTEKSDIVFIIVPDTPDVEKVLFGAGGVANGLAKGKIVVDMSTISPLATKEFARRVEEMGCFYLDCPVSGGDVGAKAGTLTMMVGGRPQIFARVKPYFELMGKTITLIGPNGDGQTAKAANQIMVGLNILAVAEALVFASKAGADPVKVRQALLGGFAASRVLEVHGERMLKRTFKPGFRTELHAKDLNIVLSGARALGVSTPATALCQELFNSCTAAGEAELDDSALVRVIERLAHHEIRLKD